MRPYAKMAMISAARSEGNGGMRGEYRMADDRRMNNGEREGGYDGGNWAASEMRRYKNGRYAPKYESDMRYDMEGRYDYDPPHFEARDNMNRIGFAAKSNVVDFDTKKMERGRKPHTSKHFSREAAEEWTRSMKNGDGSRGPHWDFEQVSQLMKQKSIQHDPYEFWAVLNAVYSDYCTVLKKHGAGNMDMYVDLAKAWLEDEDAVDDKAMMYFECVVK